MEPEYLTGIFRNHAGDIISFQTSGGRIISYRKALLEGEEKTLSKIEVNDSHSPGLPDIEGMEELPEIQ